MTKEDAIKMASTKWWKSKTPVEICRFQLFEKRLCMDFGDFHEAVEKELFRPVYTHEFGNCGGLEQEFLLKYGKVNE